MQESDPDEEKSADPANTCFYYLKTKCQRLLSLHTGENERQHVFRRTPVQRSESRDVGLACLRLSSWYLFDYCMGLVLLINSICVGVEVQAGLLGSPPTWALPLDILFVTMYICEIAIRLTAWGWRVCFTDGWFVFDYVSVVLGSASIIAQLLGPMLGSTEFLSFLNSVIVVRSLRLLRLVRALRMLRWFRTAWRLVFGLLTSGTTMTSTLGLVLLTLYVSACLGVELISKDAILTTDPTTEHIVQHHFGSLSMTMLTLAQFVTLDSIADIYRPLVYLKPALVVYFSGIILVLSISLMNLVTAWPSVD